MFAIARQFAPIKSPTVHYDADGLLPEDKLRVVMQLDASELPTGRYEWDMDAEKVSGTDMVDWVT